MRSTVRGRGWPVRTGVAGCADGYQLDDEGRVEQT